MPPPPRSPKDSLVEGCVLKPVKMQPTRHRRQRHSVSFLRLWLRLAALGLILLGAGTLIVTSVWTSLVVILRPHPPQWLVQHWPGFSQVWGDLPSETKATIEAELKTRQQFPGTLISLTGASDGLEFRGIKLLPVFETRSPCHGDCDAIVELRLYRAHQGRDQIEYLQLLDHLAIVGPEESEVLQPMADGQEGTVGSTYELPLEAIKPLHAAGLPGGWLTLTGRWGTQGSPVLYGQVLYVDPRSFRIHSLLNWHTSTGRMPTWHNVDRQGMPELLVNQSYGLEPQFKLYRVDNLTALNATTRLQEIALQTVPLPAKADEKTYRNGIFLAQRGLWNEAQGLLMQLKASLGGQWTLDLEQQLQLVSLHARFSAAQADRDWSQPSQRLLALLLDGQWQTALARVKTAEDGVDQAVLPLLERDSSRLWQRLTATLKVNPHQREAKLWSALVMMTKENEEVALKWLSSDEKSPLREEFTTIAQKVSTPPPSPMAIAAAKPSTPAQQVNGTVSPSPVRSSTVLPWSRLMGTAKPLSGADVDSWQRPTNQPAPTLTPGQQWYRVDLQLGHDRSDWQRQFPPSPVTSPEAIGVLWQTLGLRETHARLQLVQGGAGEPLQTLTVSAMQQNDRGLALLAIGAPLPSQGPLMAVTPGTWNRPAAPATPLISLLETQPDLGDRVLVILQDHLGFDPAALTFALQNSTDAALAIVQRINLVDDATPELLLTLAPDLAVAQGLAPTANEPTQLVLSTTGELLYSNLWMEDVPAVTGWVSAAAGQPVLVASGGDRVHFLVWSPQSRQFQ